MEKESHNESGAAQKLPRVVIPTRLQWNVVRAKVTTIKEAKDLATLPLDELIKNLKDYDMVVDNDGVGSKTTKETVKSLALKAKGNRFRKGRGNSFGNKGGESSKPKRTCYNYGIEGHFASECRKPKENKAFVGGAWSDSEDGDEQPNDATCLMAIDSQEVCLKCDILPDDWIMDSGCTKHITGNRRLFTLYKAYDGRHVIFRSNLKGKVVDGVSFTKVDCDISKNGKLLAKGHIRDDLYPCKLGDNSKQQICLASVVDNLTL
nr:hypothetical protein [Tanacetum cinerariifolium]